MTDPIDRFIPRTGRTLKEDGSRTNIGDRIDQLVIYGSPLTYAVSQGNGNIISCDVVAQAGETVGLAVWHDYTTVVSHVDVINADGPVVRRGEADGDHGEICSANALNLLLPSNDQSQAQVINSAIPDGLVLANGSVANSIITNGTQPYTILAENDSATEQTVSIFVTFFTLDQDSSLTLLQADTALTPTTEMSDYGPN